MRDARDARTGASSADREKPERARTRNTLTRFPNDAAEEENENVSVSAAPDPSGASDSDGWGDWGDDDAFDSPPAAKGDAEQRGEHRRQPPSSSSDAARAFASSSHADDASANDPGELRVRYFPLHFVPVAASAFVFPRDAFASTAPVALANVSRRPIGGGGEEGGGKGGPTHQYTSYSPSPLLPPPDVDGSEEDGSVVPVPPGVPAIAHAVVAMLARLGADGRAGNRAPQFFGLGRTSVAVARHCASASPPAEGEDLGWHEGVGGGLAGRTCAFVFVDRTVDLLAPAAHAASDAFFAKAMDFAISQKRRVFRKFGDDFFSEGKSDDSFEATTPFSSLSTSWTLAHPHDRTARAWLDAALSKSAADAVISARRQCADALREEASLSAAAAAAKNKNTDADAPPALFSAPAARPRAPPRRTPPRSTASPSRYAATPGRGFAAGRF